MQESGASKGGMSLKGSLYVVATPIGNLRDITLRALDVLREVDAIAAEDTRVSAKLLQHYAIKNHLISVHSHNEASRSEQIIEMLEAGKSIALISDAGTPTISDPGSALVRSALEHGITVTPIPGPNAALAALCASGFDAAHFLFYGFLPSKKGERRGVLAELAQLAYPIVFYEAPHRVADCLADLAEIFGAQRRLAIARELTKLFESHALLPLSDASTWLAADPNNGRGEFVFIVEPAAPLHRSDGLDPATAKLLGILLAELPLKQAVGLAQRISGAKRNMLYDAALKINANG